MLVPSPRLKIESSHWLTGLSILTTKRKEIELHRYICLVLPSLKTLDYDIIHVPPVSVLGNMLHLGRWFISISWYHNASGIAAYILRTLVGLMADP